MFVIMEEGRPIRTAITAKAAQIWADRHKPAGLNTRWKVFKRSIQRYAVGPTGRTTFTGLEIYEVSSCNLEV